jgi:hypothetical protein
VLNLLSNQYQAAAIPKQEFYPISTLRPEYNQRSIKRVLAKAGGSQSGEAMGAAAKIHRACRQHNPHAGWDRDHEAAARTARSTAVSVWASTPLATRILAPSMSISIPGGAATATDGGGIGAVRAGVGISATTGMNAGPEGPP